MSDSKIMTSATVKRAEYGNQPLGPLTILQRLRDKDRSAVEDCLNRYGAMVWTLAKKHTDSLADAESMTMKIFEDIWRITLQDDRNIRTTEEFFVAFLACQRLGIAANRLTVSPLAEQGRSIQTKRSTHTSLNSKAGRQTYTAATRL